MSQRPVSKIAVDIIRLNRMILDLEVQIQKTKELVNELTADFCTLETTDTYRLIEHKHESKEF